MKLKLSVISREEAKEQISTNESMMNFYAYVLHSKKEDSKNLFNGSNLILISTEHLKKHGAKMFIHEVCHSLLKYKETDEIAKKTSFEHGGHSDETDSYMSGSKVGDKEFTYNDLLSLSVPYDEKYDKNQDRTYGMVLEQEHSSNQYLFKISIYKKHRVLRTDAPKYCNYPNHKVPIMYLNLKKSLTWRGSGIFKEFIFEKKYIDLFLNPAPSDKPKQYDKHSRENFQVHRKKI